MNENWRKIQENTAALTKKWFEFEKAKAYEKGLETIGVDVQEIAMAKVKSDRIAGEIDKLRDERIRLFDEIG